MLFNMSTSPLEKSAFPEGMQGYIGNNSSGMPPLGLESGDNMYLLAKRMTLERQNSLPNTYPYWTGREAAPMVPNSDIVHDSTPPHSNLLSSVGDNPCQQPHSRNLMSILQGLPDKSPVSLNNGVGGWSTFPIQGGLDPLQEKAGPASVLAIGPETRQWLGHDICDSWSRTRWLVLRWQSTWARRPGLLKKRGAGLVFVEGET